MAARRRQSQLTSGATVDPGKDLFAYLFLMIMVFCFMLMMAAHDATQSVEGQQSPEKQDSAASSSMAQVSVESIGQLVKKKGEIYIQYGEVLYSPKKDVAQMETDGRVMTITDKNGVEKKVLYIEETNDQQVLLTEYLSAFQHLSKNGIGVAFAERINE